MSDRCHFICMAIIVAIIALMCLGFGQPPGHMVEEIYTVKSGDTLWTVGERYMEKNTYAPRDIREFCEGIYELNYEAVFMDREAQGAARPKEVFPGDELKIRYWVKSTNLGGETK